MISEVRAAFKCDECGRSFSVDVDTAFVGKPEWSVFEIAEDAIRHGRGYSDSDREGAGYSGSVKSDGTHLCHVCTKKEDNG